MVVGGVVHEVGSRADIGVRSGGDEVEAEGAAGSGDTVRSGVISTIERAVLGTSGGVGAEGGVPCVSGVAVCVSAEDSEN